MRKLRSEEVTVSQSPVKGRAWTWRWDCNSFHEGWWSCLRAPLWEHFLTGWTLALYISLSTFPTGLPCLSGPVYQVGDAGAGSLPVCTLDCCSMLGTMLKLMDFSSFHFYCRIYLFNWIDVVGEEGGHLMEGGSKWSCNPPSVRDWKKNKYQEGRGEQMNRKTKDWENVRKRPHLKAQNQFLFKCKHESRVWHMCSARASDYAT